MLTEQEILQAISQLETSPPTLTNCEKLATYYTIYDHLHRDAGYSTQAQPLDLVNIQGSSPLVHAVNGKPQQAVWDVLIELVDGLQSFAPKLYQVTMDELSDI